MLSSIRTFLDDESGATAIEYGLIAALMVLVLLVGLNTLADAMIEMYTGSDDSLRGVVEGSNPGGS